MELFKMSESVTEAEIRAVRWVEHVLAPLLVMSVLTLATCASQTQKVVAELEVKQSQVERINGDTKQAIKDINTKQGVIIRQQHTLEINVKRIETHQEHFKDELIDLKQQNVEILRLLREGE